MASIVERPQGAAPQSSTAPMLTTDRLPVPAAAPPAPATTSHWPDEAYRGWSSL